MTASMSRSLSAEPGKWPALEVVMAAHRYAVAKHPLVPHDLDGQATVLAEEILELAEQMVQAALGAVRAVNDHRDESPCLGRVAEELAHVGAVALRGLDAVLPALHEPSLFPGLSHGTATAPRRR